jgi:low temperature requirement protein LtrA
MTTETATPGIELLDADLQPDRRVTALELFFDLVFVFAITQLTGYVSRDPTWTRVVEALAILATLWWVWSAYAWLGNRTAADEGPVRGVLLAAMGAMLVVSLAVPTAFGAGALAFGIGYFLARVLHLGAFMIVSRGDPELRYVVGRLARSILPVAFMLLAAGIVDGTARTVLWAAAIAVDYGGLLLTGTTGWHVQAAHFAERHGLVIIVALGESVVSLGVGASGLGLGAGVIIGALLGGAVAAAMWWAYFDVVALVAERRLRGLDDASRSRMARDSYTYLHLPMVAGIILFAVGVKKTLGHVGEELEIVPAVCMCCGVALYLVALSAFKRRNIGSFNYPRLVAAAALAAFTAVAVNVSAIAALAVVATISCALIAYEVLHYASARDRIRHYEA